MLSSQRDPKSAYPKFESGWLELDYFRRPRWLRGARKYLTGGVCLAAVTLAGVTLLPVTRHVHQAGPVSTAHAAFGHQCGQCHRAAFQPLRRFVSGDDQLRSVSDTECLSCHDGPLHHAEAPTRACATCHREHRGRPSLAWPEDGHCTACHANLAAVHPATCYRNVADFATHPPFRPSQPGQTDNAQVAFNHQLHLQIDFAVLKKARGPSLADLPDRLECSACHQPDAARRYMQPINYESHCARCHILSVRLAGDFPDPPLQEAVRRFHQEPAPHREPEVVRATLRERLVRFVQENPVVPGEPRAASPVVRWLPGRSPREVTEPEWSWVKRQLAEAEGLLFVNRQLPPVEQSAFLGGDGCRHCHVGDGAPAGRPDDLPHFRKTNIPARWFTHSRFRHDSHRELKCTECHAQALTSTRTSDVLLPTLETCQKCHRDPGGARTACAECHTYHDHRQERSFDGPLTIREFLNGPAGAPEAGPPRGR
jgi:hypothetical protein